MEKRKRWQMFIILAVVVLTFYNILPTIFYYSKPLKKPITKQEAQKVSLAIVNRVNELEKFTISWLKAQSKNLGLKPTSISIDSQDPRLARVKFRKAEEANFFSQILSRAGNLITFDPARLYPARMGGDDVDNSTVIVERRIGVHLNPSQSDSYFHFVQKVTDKGAVSKEYQELIGERVISLAKSLGGVSEPARILVAISKDKATSDEVLKLARSIVEYENAFGENSEIAKRFFASFTQVDSSVDHSNLVQKFVSQLEKNNLEMGSLISNIREEQKKVQDSGLFFDAAKQQRLDILANQKSVLEAATTIVRRNNKIFEQGSTPVSQQDLEGRLLSSPVPEGKVQSILIDRQNPFVKSIEIDWNKEQFNILLHPDVVSIREQDTKTEMEAIRREKLNQFLFNDIAAASRKSDEVIVPFLNHFTVTINKLTNSSSLLALDIGALGAMQAKNIENMLKESLKSVQGELSLATYPVYSYEEFEKLQPQEKKLGFVVYAPAKGMKKIDGFRNSSIYVIARSFNTINKKYDDLADSPEKKLFKKEVLSLQDLMIQNGFISYPGSASTLPEEFKEDYVFELDDYTHYLLAATREDFVIKGSKKYATLEFTDLEQRILAVNKIETRIHEDLIKWRDEYKQARVSLNKRSRYDVPAPTSSILLNNLKFSFKKFFRGDEKKILKWGLDLSGGKTVRIGLKDRHNQIITSEVDVRQAANELYRRVNKLGVSEIGLRTEGNTIVLDFPGSQGFSAADLIKTSAMQFHVVNEKFTSNNSSLGEAVNMFLEEVWNEAVITNRTDTESINEIAWQHLGGSLQTPMEFHPMTNHAKLLYENGLRLASPRNMASSSAFDDSLSSISLFRGTEYSEWHGQTYPLLVIFRNHALEGSNLDNITTGYDRTDGNTLYFEVKSSYVNRNGEKINPRDDFAAWTSQFAEDKIVGTIKETYSHGRGWRMAVVLNGTIISAPTLHSALRENARISGNFSQREINQLAADLKAGSLSFTPHILSEENVSPDLGYEQRMQGIFSAILGLVLVVLVMCVYYRFSGLIASIAVVFNLLIMWAVLQNLGAALTLPGIAGIILAVGMSVDANVLVCERIREEFSVSGRLPSAVAAGYRKAFTAILDSNLTTIIAALILLNFDSGPVKGFALTLIIGITSSMFTALFMTRFFFAGWVQNPNHKKLNMASFFGKTSIDFLRKAKPAMIISLILIVFGSIVLVKERKTIFGMDFTGGYAITLDLLEKSDVKNYKQAAESALTKAGASSNDFQIQELNKPNRLRIQLGMGMEQYGKPFYNIDSQPHNENALFAYQDYPRIVWIVDCLEKEGLSVNPASLPNLNLSWTEMSGQLSDTMRNQALIGLGLALLCILVYITFRFEFKYAISATIALTHDLLITVGLLAIFHIFYGGIQIDLQVIAALMTIVGYSLNDTIIIFDRIREEIQILRKMSFYDIVNHALNATLSRTVMTSGTTMVVLLALVAFGGRSIMNFSLIMTFGVAIGTFSSLYIAAPLLLYFQKREERVSSPKGV